MTKAESGKTIAPSFSGSASASSNRIETLFGELATVPLHELAQRYMAASEYGQEAESDSISADYSELMRLISAVAVYRFSENLWQGALDADDLDGPRLLTRAYLAQQA